MEELHAIFHGQVQGVFFRATITRHAQKIGITGYVENLSDGTVKMVAQGKKQALEQLLNEIKENPGQAKISHVDLEYSEIKTLHNEFVVKRRHIK